MAWWIVALVVASFIATLLLTPKPKFENARSSGLDDLRFPTATEGAPVPLIFGRGLIRGPNTIWSGDFEARPIKKKIKTGLFSSKRVIVGYEYFVGLDLCLALGPCTLHRIISDKDELWSGTASTDGAAVNINKPSLYGGREEGGGFVSNCVFYTGSTTQGADSYLTAQIGAGNVPAYRGFCHIVFPKANIGEANQLRPMQFELSRYSNDLAFTGGMERIGDDMNPMELLFQAFVLEFGGLNIPIAMLDLVSMKACGETLFAEGNGMTLIISTPNSGKDIANEVMRQVDAILYQDPATGKIVTKLIRNDYVLEDLPVFDESNVIAIRSFTSKMWEDTINQIRVNFTNRQKNYEKGTAVDQDLANIGAQGRLRTATISYPGCMEPDLAVELATRDLSQSSVPLLGATMELNRQAASLRPGDPFVWSWGAYGLEQVVMRVKNFDLGALNDNRISIEATQDEFAVGLTVFAAPDGAGSGPVAPSDPAAALATRFVGEAPYFFSAMAEIGIASSQGVLMVSAVPGTGAVSYSVFVSTDTVEYSEAEAGIVFAPTGTLVTNIGQMTGITTGIFGSIVISTSSDELESVPAANIPFGAGLFFIGTELFAHEAVTDNGDGTFTLSNVRRALLDTPIQAHTPSTRVWFMSGDNVVDAPQPGTAALRVKMAPRTFSDTLDPASAPFDALTMSQRALRPLQPGRIQFGGGAMFAAPATPEGSRTITWANRSRLESTVRNIIDSASANETGQETILRYRIGSGSWTEVVIAPGAVSHTFNAGALATDIVTYELYSRRDGLTSAVKWSGYSGGNLLSIPTGTILPPPSAPGDPNFANVVLLAHFNGADGSTSFIDVKGKTLTAVGNAQIDTAQSVFGGASGLFDGTGDRVTAADSADWSFGSGPFTIELFARHTTKQSEQTYVTQWFPGWAFYVQSGQLSFRATDTLGNFLDLFQPWVPVLGTWYHLCVERDNTGKLRLYVDGTMIASNASTFNVAFGESAEGLAIGAIGTGGIFPSFDFNGHMEELRITKGVARYASDSGFTVPAAPFPDA